MFAKNTAFPMPIFRWQGKQEPWKAPLAVFIEDIYYKRFGKRRPDNAKSIEQIAKVQEEKKAERRKRKQLKKQSAATRAKDSYLTT
jgi:hypothetical protein